MTLNVNYVTDLAVLSDRTEIDTAFFNRRFKALYDELSRLDTEFSTFGDTEDTLVALGLSRLNDTLNPLVTTLQAAASLGFLWGQSIGTNISLITGQAEGFFVTVNADLLVPTPVLMVQDMTDPSNWGLVSVDVDGWHSDTGDLATHCIYASKTQSSSQWFITCSAAIFPAMQDLLAQCTSAKNATAASAASVATQMATLQGAINAINSGPVASVAGRTGVVTLAESDIANLVSDLAAKATTTYVNTQISTKQNTSAKLDTLVNLVLAPNKLIYATSASALGTTDISDYAKTLIDDPDAPTALGTLGVSPFVKTMLGNPDATTVKATLGIAAGTTVPVKATSAQVAAGTDDTNFVTSLGAFNTYLPRTATPVVPAKASTAEAIAGVEDTKFVTSVGVAGAVSGAVSSINSNVANTYMPKIVGFNSQSGASYTLVASDNGMVVRFTSASAVTCTLPASLPIGFTALIDQFGVGQVSIAVATNATRRSFSNKFKLAGQNAVASVFCEANSDGAHSEWNISGNLVP